jgi:hypothetical protein
LKKKRMEKTEQEKQRFRLNLKDAMVMVQEKRSVNEEEEGSE